MTRSVAAASVAAAPAARGDRQRLRRPDLRQPQHDARRLHGLGRVALVPGVPRARAAHFQGGALRQEVVRGGVRDLDRHHVTRAHLLVGLGEVHQAVVGGAAGEAVGGAVLAALALGDHQLQRAADLLLVLVPGDLLLEGDKTLVARLHDLLGDLPIHRRRRCAGALGVLERKRLREAGLADRVQGLLEVLLGLAGEAHDDVGGDRGVRDRGADVVDDPEVALLPVRAAHRLQDGVRTGLHRHVQLRHDVRCLGHRGDDVVREVARVRRGEADALQALDLPAGPQELAEGLAVADVGTVSVYVLSEQRDLGDALADQGLDLGEDVAGPAVLLLAAQRRDDAEGARVVAAHGDGDPGRVRALAAGRQRRGERFERLGDLDLRLFLYAGALQEDGQLADVVRTEDDVHPGRLLHDGVAVLLGEAAADGDLHAGPLRLHRREPAEVPVETVVGVLPHRAGVEDDDVGVTVGAVGRAYVSGVLEQSGEPFRVVDVHLTPVGLDTVRAWEFHHVVHLWSDRPRLRHRHTQ